MEKELLIFIYIALEFHDHTFCQNNKDFKLKSKLHFFTGKLFVE